MGDHGEPSGPDPLKAWREAWLRADFSWDGLLDPEKEAEGFDSLQAYWRANPETGTWRSDQELKALGELIAVEGQKTYHLAHLPLYYPDSAPTLKAAAPDEVEGQLSALLRVRLLTAVQHDKEGQPRPPACLQGVVFLNADYSKKNFDSAVNASFGLCLFSNDANFRSATFSGNVDFTSAAFFGHAYFGSAAFSGDVNFRRATFYGGAYFYGSKFYGDAYFRSAAFSKSASFESAVFSGNADFCKSKFERLYRSFYLATFSAVADFRRLKWPESPSAWRQAFYATRFKSFAIFEDFGLKAFAAFDGVKFESDLRIDKVSDVEARKAFEAELRAATSDDVALRQIEGGCRVLKQAMEKAADKSREQLLYRFELIARRKQKATPWPEKMLSWIYAHFSGYGGSSWRPARGLLLLYVGFALFYAPMTYVIDAKPKPTPSAQAKITWEIDSDRIAQVLTVSASRMFPFGAYDEVSKDFAKKLSDHNIWIGFGYRFLATVQSFLSLTMAFLFALAVRRRFQIS